MAIAGAVGLVSGLVGLSIDPIAGSVFWTLGIVGGMLCLGLALMPWEDAK